MPPIGPGTVSPGRPAGVARPLPLPHRSAAGGRMPQVVDLENVSTVGLDSSPVAEALAGLRANEARYFKNKYGHVFTVSPADEEPETLDWMTGILADERGIIIS